MVSTTEVLVKGSGQVGACGESLWMKAEAGNGFCPCSTQWSWFEGKDDNNLINMDIHDLFLSYLSAAPGFSPSR
jgi:hypothetical protein